MILMMRFIIIISLFITGCSSTNHQKQQPSFHHLVKLNPPIHQKAVPSRIYIDTVKIIDYKQEKALLISGNFANGCTRLKTASHTFSDDSLSISLTAWQPAGKSCTQVLQPFSFVYDEIPGKRLQRYESIAINHKKFQIKQP